MNQTDTFSTERRQLLKGGFVIRRDEDQYEPMFQTGPTKYHYYDMIQPCDV